LLFTVGTHTLQSIFTVICSSEHPTHTQFLCSTGYLEL